MKFLSLGLLTFALSIVPARVYAGPTWSLDWEFGSNALVSDNGRGLLLFKPHDTTSSSQSANPVVAYLGVATRATATHPDHYTNQIYAIELRLTDLVSHQFRNFWFVGELNGSVSQASSHLTNRMLNRDFHTGIILGHNIYDISFGPFINPVPNDHIAGRFYAHVDYLHFPIIDPPSKASALTAGPMSGSAQVGSPHDSPEPSSGALAIAGLAIFGTLGLRWRRMAFLAPRCA
jgi:hypothetical protein